MKCYKHFICIFLFAFLLRSTQAQELKKDLLVSLKVICIDSEYLMIPSMELLSNRQDLEIHKKLTYGNETDGATRDCIFYLQKLTGNVYVNMYVQAFRQLIPEEDYYALKKLTKQDFLNDTINLKTYSPLEPGEYRISIALRYFSRGTNNTSYSDWFGFKVLYKPKNSLF